MGAAFSISSALFWALAVVLFKKSGETVSPLPLNLFKSALALLVLVPAALLVEGGTLLPDRSAGDCLLIALSGVLGFAVSDTLFLAALNRLGAGLNAVVDCVYSPAMVLFAFTFLGEGLPPPALLGGGLVVAAVVLGSGRRSPAGRADRRIGEGIFLGVLGMFFVAGSIVMIKPLLRPEEILHVATLRLLAGTLALLPTVLLLRGRASLARVFVPSRVWRSAVPAALFGNVLAMGCWVAGMTLLQVSTSAILNQLSTIFIFLLAALMLKEPVTRRRTAAVALAFTGAVLVLLS